MILPSKVSFLIKTSLLTLLSLFFLNGCGHKLKSYYPSSDSLTIISDVYGTEHKESLNLNKDLVKLVDFDKNTGSYLLRGNSPVTENTFNYSTLVSFMADAASPLALPGKYKIIDVSLLNRINPKDREVLAAEKSFWNKNPDKGSLVNHAIFGNLTSPDIYPGRTKKILEKLPTPDRLDELVVQLKMLLSQASTDTLIYVHCQAGKDRTGEVIAAYSMKYQGRSYSDAIKNARSVAGRRLSIFSENAIKWYAWYLSDVERIPTIGPIE